MEPLQALNAWTGLLLAAAVQGVFLSLLIASAPKKKGAAKWLLAALILSFAVTLFDYVGYWTRWHHQSPWLADQYLWLSLTAGPLFYLYMRSIYTSQPIRRRDWLHALPAMAMILAHWPFYAAETASKLAMLKGDLPLQRSWWLPTWFLEYRGIAVITIAQLVLYAGWSYRLPYGKAPVRQRYARTMNALYLGFVGSYLLYYITVGSPWFSLLLDYSISLAMVVFIYTIGLLGYRQRIVFESGQLKAALQPGKYRNSALTPSSLQSLINRLEGHMRSQRPYLDNELRLPQLAEAIGCTTHHLSQAINERFQQTFSNYINQHRVWEAQRLLRHPEWEERSIMDVAYAAGFNNKTTFYQAFKAEVGALPSEFREGKTTVSRQHL